MAFVMWRSATSGLSIAVLTAFATLQPSPATAVCLDPTTGISGYKIPLAVEIRASRAIVIGRVTSERPLREDASDPDGISAYVYTFEVSRVLKGRVPALIMLRAQNDSGGYRMSVGERHLLFLSKPASYFEADSCGNATELPRGDLTVRKVEDQLAGRAKPP